MVAVGAALFLVAPSDGALGFAGRPGALGHTAGVACRARGKDLDATQDTAMRLRFPLKRPKGPTEEEELQAEVPYPRAQTEIMVDAMSVIRHYWQQKKVNEYGMVIENDPHSYWPARVYCALRPIVRHYGLDRPPSPWKPVTVVYDIPDPSHTKSGLKVRKWGSLHKQGPREVGRGECGPYGAEMTFAFAQTYVDQSAAERYRCDKEILWMLEVLTRDYPRRQVLVTGDKWLQKAAKKYCLVRDVAWLEKEILAEGEEGQRALAPLKGQNEDMAWATKGLPKGIKRAFTIY